MAKYLVKGRIKTAEETFEPGEVITGFGDEENERLVSLDVLEPIPEAVKPVKQPEKPKNPPPADK